MQIKYKSTLIFTLLISIFSIESCQKEKIIDNEVAENVSTLENNNPNLDYTLTKVMTVANIQPINDGFYSVCFLENAQVFKVKSNEIVNALKSLYKVNQQVKVSYDPWSSEIIALALPGTNELTSKSKTTVDGSKGVMHIDLKKSIDDDLNSSSRIGILNTSAPSTGLVNVVPDMATAQLMFNYLATQCCAVPGPYSIDYCISFQYAYDGCYARAHKMCYILNNKYHYDTHKIFSFANAGSDVLGVQAQKWGGCCINWWYHVAPLVNIKTPSGVKAYVFDPSMFDQPVLLSVWLHAQENPACGGWGTPNVSMINIQPTSSYSPSGWSGYTFDTDPFYFDTNSTLVSYGPLTTC